MSRTPPNVILNFRRTFALLIVLIVLPSAGLSGFGVVAIINERAAVEKRLEAAWKGTLEALAEELPQELRAASLLEQADGPALITRSGRVLSESGFRVDAEGVKTDDAPLAAALAAVRPEAGNLPEELTVFSMPMGGRATLVATERQGSVVRGARLSPEAVEALLAEHAERQVIPGEPVRFSLLPVPREVGDGSLVSRLMSEVAQARANALGPAVLAERVLSLPSRTSGWWCCPPARTRWPGPPRATARCTACCSASST